MKLWQDNKSLRNIHFVDSNTSILMLYFVEIYYLRFIIFDNIKIYFNTSIYQ